MNNVLKVPEWNEWFMRMVYLVSTRSKDKSSKIGSVLVNDSNQIVKVGYNGFPCGVSENIPSRQERPLKYSFVAHSEANCVFFAARDGVRTSGTTLYTNGISCNECAKAIIQAGIKTVVYHKQFQDKWEEFKREKWEGHVEITKSMFDEAKVKLIQYNKILNLTTIIDGKIINV